jgi:hypothetical protein
MSATCSWRSSAFRIPVEYKTISIVRCDRLFDAQNLWQPTRRFGIRRVVEQISPLQRLHEEDAQPRHVEGNVSGRIFGSRSRYAW